MRRIRRVKGAFLVIDVDGIQWKFDYNQSSYKNFIPYCKIAKKKQKENFYAV
jgi:hypothetical protein